ncbi:MAG: hypothetical protein WAV56_03385 [Microgenomates group bacterium]
MKDRRKKILAVGLLIIVFLLTGAGLYVAYLLQKAPVPTAPPSQPRAAEWLGGGNCNTSFTVAAATGTPTATATPTATTTGTPGAPNPCNGDCGSDSNCQTGLICYDAGAAGKRCRNPQNPTSETCEAPTATPTGTATATVTVTATGTVVPTVTIAATPTETPTATPTAPVLPEAGILNLPGAAAFGGGLLLTILGILFAL